jgi:dephospho-CoA kinase
LNVFIIVALYIGSKLQIIGLTGGIATGKSTVSKILSENGFDIIDADLIAREVSLITKLISDVFLIVNGG